MIRKKNQTKEQCIKDYFNSGISPEYLAKELKVHKSYVLNIWYPTGKIDENFKTLEQKENARKEILKPDHKTEKQILKKLRAGHSDKVIAFDLNISLDKIKFVKLQQTKEQREEIAALQQMKEDQETLKIIAYVRKNGIVKTMVDHGFTRYKVSQKIRRAKEKGWITENERIKD